MCFKSDADRSIRAFNKFTRHVLNHFFDSNKMIRSFEGSNNPAERDLDRKHGIDGVVVDRDDWARYFASRISFVTGYNTFTVRGYRPSGTATEIHKIGRVDEPKPEYHVQTYVDVGGHGAVVGIVETAELLQWIDRHKPEMKFNRSDGVGFFWVDFAALAGARVYRVDASGLLEDVTAQYKASAT